MIKSYCIVKIDFYLWLNRAESKEMGAGPVTRNLNNKQPCSIPCACGTNREKTDKIILYEDC